MTAEANATVTIHAVERAPSPPLPKWHFAFVAAVAFVLYLPSLRFSFVWDDTFFIVRNPAVQSPRYLWAYFTDATTYAWATTPGLYRPLRNISFLLDYVLVGLRPAWWHLHNVLLHTLNAVLVLWVVNRVVALRPSPASRAAALVATLLWVCHPVHTEAVAWVKSRDEMLFTAFYLAAFGLAWQAYFWRQFRARTCILVLLLFAGALLSKEMAASLPIVLSMGLWLLTPRDARRLRLPSAVLLLAGQLALLLAFVYVRHRVLGQTAQCPRLSGSLLGDMLTMVRAAARYVTLSVAPIRQLADYQAFGVTRSLAEPRWWVAVAILAASVGAWIAIARRDPRASFGMAWFWIALLPVSNIIPTMQFLAERFLYLPLVGLAVTVAALLDQAWYAAAQSASPQKAKQVAIVAATWLTLFVSLTSVRVHVWRDETILFATTYLDSPPCARIAQNLAVALTNRGQPEAAIQILEEVLADRQGVYKDMNAVVLECTLAQALVLSGRPAEALVHADRALALNLQYEEAWQIKGLAYGRMGDHERALACFVQALRTNPAAAEKARQNIRTALRYLGRFEDLKAFERGQIPLEKLAPPLPPPSSSKRP
ncbi:TPR domain protein [Candidatus Sumerlaea chitinivorans]|uniref:TPR domain protein n=1 Tax=Sumerlaea chitinivorans TaxID=2250252 RepID=A0A2Z4Y7B1_SUMC1|nr:TPR domain protein [Candidatus Sumerlaea chitinivorans]